MNIASAMVLAGAAFVAALVPSAALAAAPAAGDVYVYRVVNQYNKELLGQLRIQVDRAGPEGYTLSVTPSGAAVGSARTLAYDQHGNWLRHPVESHGKPVEYVFATPYPAYVLPLGPGKTWSVRVKATPEGGGRARTVRVYGKVLATERVRVPAGEFDAIKIERRAYSGDAEGSVLETRVTETEWYAPALGRPVRYERNSVWRDASQCGRGIPCDFRGDWSLIELVEARTASR